MHLYYANTISETLLRDLKPYCLPGYCHIAGSIRHKKEEVKDVEIVCIPQQSVHKELNLFQEVISERLVIHPEFERIIKESGSILKGKFTGRYMQVEMKKEFEGTQHTINLDLFMPQQHDYFRQLAIRTGSADYARYHIATSWVKKGWCGVNGDLYMQAECYRESDKHPWKLRPGITDPKKPTEWKSEEEFFKWLGVTYLEPQHRNL